MAETQTAHLSEEERTLILRDNAARIYRIDVAALPSRLAA
jgi:predicted TIM-barrel fold metal-dependent hydrolase